MVGKIVIPMLLDKFGEMTGREIREAIGWWSVAAFYSMMSKLEDAGIVIRHDRAKIIDGIFVTERVYRMPFAKTTGNSSVLEF